MSTSNRTVPQPSDIAAFAQMGVTIVDVPFDAFSATNRISRRMVRLVSLVTEMNIEYVCRHHSSSLGVRCLHKVRSVECSSLLESALVGEINGTVSDK